MTNLGYLLITVGFLAGSLIAVQTEANHVNWAWFIPSLLLALVGVVLAQLSLRAETRETGKLQSNIDDLLTSIDRIVNNIDKLVAEEHNPYDYHGLVDKTFLDDFNIFVEARESVGHVYGLQAYAEVMNEYAAGERYLNRVWSASVDGYIDEIKEYVQRSAEQFHKTQQILLRLKAGSSSAD